MSVLPFRSAKATRLMSIGTFSGIILAWYYYFGDHMRRVATRRMLLRYIDGWINMFIRHMFRTSPKSQTKLAKAQDQLRAELNVALNKHVQLPPVQTLCFGDWSIMPRSTSLLLEWLHKRARADLKVWGSGTWSGMLYGCSVAPWKAPCNADSCTQTDGSDVRGSDVEMLTDMNWLQLAFDDCRSLHSYATAWFSYSNTLHPDAFPNVRQMEAEVVSMVCAMFSADVGLMSSGGTESIFLAMLAYRNQAIANGRSHATEWNVVACETVHAAFEKACHYLGMHLYLVPCDPKTGSVDLKRLERAIDPHTLCIVGSAPNYANGVMDDTVGLDALAELYSVGFHLDACLGGFLLPFSSVSTGQLPANPTSFKELPHMSSLSVDAHKYGITPKGVSTILFRTPELREHVYSVFPHWTGGIYATPGMAGSRSGLPVVFAWCTLHRMGIEGYQRMCSVVQNGVRYMVRAIQDSDLLQRHVAVIGQPDLCTVAIRSAQEDILNVYGLAGVMQSDHDIHWNVLQNPASIHWTVTLSNVDQLRTVIRVLEQSVRHCLRTPEHATRGSATLYGTNTSITSGYFMPRMIRTYLNVVADTRE